MTIEEVVFDQNKAYSQKEWAFDFLPLGTYALRLGIYTLGLMVRG
jgi:hypothetical protein